MQQNIKHIDVGSVLENYNCSMEIYLVVLSAYTEDSENMKERLKSAYSANDIGKYRILVHSLKGLSYGIGAKELGDLAFAHEKAAREDNIDFLRDSFGELMSLFDTVLNEAEQILHEEIPKRTLINDYTDKLRTLYEYISNYQMVEAEELLENIDIVDISGIDIRSSFQSLAEAVSLFDAQSAAEQIDRLITELARI